jgi:hypothetical protein
MPSLSRRHALRLGATGLAAGIAGCSGMPSDAVIATDPAVSTDATPTPDDEDEDEGEEVTVVRVADIPDLQASIAKTAVRERVYHVCEPSDAVGALASRFRLENSYIGVDGEHYPVYARVADQIFASTADAPDTDGCGFL